MVIGTNESYQDPWAWLHEPHTSIAPDYGRFQVVALVPSVLGEPFTTRCLDAIAAAPIPVQVVTELDGSAEGDWIWLVPDDVEPTPPSLTALLDRVRSEPDVAVVGGLLVEPRRRGAGTLISDWAQTISGTGRVRPLTESGELYQGQLDAQVALGVPAGGMLVRGDAWRFLSGVNADLPRSLWGLDFGWRANLAGYRVVAEPTAQLVDYAELDDDADVRAAGLALVSGNAAPAWRWLVSLRLILTVLLTALGFLLGKDPARAADELRGLGRWLGGRRLRRGVVDGVATLPVTPAARRHTASLRPGRGSGVRRAADQTAARFSDWLRGFTGRAQGASLDEMTGDDFAAVGATRYALPLAITGLLTLMLGAVVAARGSYGAGQLSAAQLLPAPESWRQLLDSYLQPVAGAGLSGAPWAGLAGILSLLTFGRPEWLVTITLLGAVPLAWLLSFRLLRQLVADRRLAAVGALAYAVVPVLIGGLNAGSFGLAALAVLLPILSYSLLRWLGEGEWQWRRAGASAFWVLLACSLAPALWVVALAAAIWSAVRARSGPAWGQWALVLAAPGLLLIGGWGDALWRYPGRLLTGIEPTLAPSAPVEPWLVLVGNGIAGAAPVWLSIVFYLACWLAALVAAVRRPRLAGPALVLAGAATVLALVLTRLVVQVPPGSWVRPQAWEWQLLIVGGLVIAACLGLDGMLAELRGRDLGLHHLANLGLVGLGAVAIGAATGWWLLDGQTGLTRSPVGQVPAFVRNAQLSATPGRTLILQSSGAQVSWSLVEGDFSRLGEAERGLAFGGDAAAGRLAASVVARLVGDTADDQLLGDLVSLGVSNVVLTGGDGHQRQAIDNVPGLGIGSGTASQYVWPVPDSAIAVLTDPLGEQRTPAGDGAEVVAGGADRVLRLAEPADPAWRVQVGESVLTAAAADGPGSVFAMGSASGTMRIALLRTPSAWLWLQLAGLVLLGILAAPSVQRRTERGPRRVVGEL